MAQHNQLGKQGEQIAIDFLVKRGYSVVEVNWRYSRYEIDVIVENNDEIVFVEVKARTTSYFGNPEEFISKSQQKRIIEAAHYYLTENNVDKPARFDVISILGAKGSKRVEHIEDAFSAIG